MNILTPDRLHDLLEPRGRRPWIALALGTASVAGLRYLGLGVNRIEQASEYSPFLLYVLAVMLASWLGGWVPGIVTTFLSLGVTLYDIRGLDGTVFPVIEADRTRAVIFLTVGALVSGLSEALHRSRERLEVQARTLQREVQERREIEGTLRELGHRKDAFLAVLAHELRNPLTPIVNAAALLHTREAADATVRRAAQLIDRHAKHMVHLIDDLLDAARIERGTFNLRLAPAQVREIIRAAIEHCRPALSAKQHELRVEVPPPPSIILADHLRVVQLVTNLLNNAIAYTPAGGEIEIIATLDDNDLTIVVRDNGQGINPQRAARIFEMFERGVPDISPSTGLGIGLALVRQIATMHGGSVAVESAGEGRGSTFTVLLPGAAMPGAVVPLAPEPSFVETPLAAPRRILLVDDNADVLESLGMVLRLLNQEVEAVATGEQALQRLEEWQPHLALIDVGMPGMSGYEVAQRARNCAWGMRLELIAMTGWGRDEDRARALAAGFNQHVVKPIDLAQLRALLDAAPAQSNVAS